MKKILKASCPPSLATYTAQNPQARWASLKEDVAAGGDIAYRETRKQLYEDQGGICAYCEARLENGRNNTFRVEHFHPKSDTATGINWNLAWANLLCVCNGGIDRRSEFGFPVNKSCDAQKGNRILDGLIINPLQIEAFPAIFTIDKDTGKLAPNKLYCLKFPSIEGNKLKTTRELIQNTIDVLHLNCERLCRDRVLVMRHIDSQKARFRKNNKSASVALSNLAEHYFCKHWPFYFTTIRVYLGEAAEKYLMATKYNG